MALLGNFLGNALGMQSAEEYTQSVEAASRLRDLQKKNQYAKDKKDFPVTNEDTGSVSGLTIPDTLDLGPLTQPPLKDIPPPMVDQEGGVADGVPIESDVILKPKVNPDGSVQVETEDGSLADAPTTDLTDPFKIEGNTLLPPPGPELPPIPKYSRANPEPHNQEVAKRNALEKAMQGVMAGAGIKRKGGQGTRNVTKEQGEAYKWWTSNEAFQLFYNNPEAFELAKQDPIVFALEYMSQRGQRVTSSVVPESAARTDKLISGRIEGLKTEISGNKVQEIYKLANEIGIDPFAAIAIFGIESDFGRVTKDSNRGAKGGMQVMPAQFERLKRWFADPANRAAIESAFTLPDGTVNQGRVDYAIEKFTKMKMPNARGQGGSGNAHLMAGIAQLVYNKAIGLPKNLWGAGYQGNANQVLQLGRPLNADDGNISNSDYNRAYVTLYNHIASTYGLALSEVQTPYGVDLNTIKGSGVGKPIMTTVEVPRENTTTTDTTADSTPRTGLTISAPPGGMFEVQLNGQVLSKFETQEQAQAYIDSVNNAGGVTKESTEVADKAVNQDDDVSIEMFVNNPSSIPITTQRILDERKLVTDKIQTQIDEINRGIAIQNRRAAEFARLAALARRTGQFEAEESYLAQRDAARQNAEDLREAGVDLVQQGKEAVFAYDSTLLLAQGAQALQDLSYGSTARAGAVLSAYSGYNIQIVPRSDGKYDMVVEGKVQATYTKEQLADRLQSAFDGEYRKSKQTRAAKRADQVFEKNLDTAAEIKKIEAQLVSTLATEAAKAAYAQELERIKNSKGQVYSLGDGKAIIKTADGRYIFMDPAGQVPVPGKKGEFTRGLVKKILTTDDANAIIAGVDATQGGDPYKTN